MYATKRISGLWLLALFSKFTNAGPVLKERDLHIPDPSEFNYTIEHPYAIPAKPNGLDVERPNMILFMPDQLRFDSVGVFGNDVCPGQFPS